MHESKIIKTNIIYPKLSVNEMYAKIAYESSMYNAKWARKASSITFHDSGKLQQPREENLLFYR